MQETKKALQFEAQSFGADDENRTHIKSLGSSRFTTKLHPHLPSLYGDYKA